MESHNNREVVDMSSLHGFIKKLSDFCTLSRGRLALSPWTLANLRNNYTSGPKWGALMKAYSTSPFLASVSLHTCCTLQPYASEHSRVSRVFQQAGPSFSLVNAHLHSSCTAVLVSCSGPFSLIMQKGSVYTQLKGTSQCYCFCNSEHCCQQSGSKFIDSSSQNLSC